MSADVCVNPLALQDPEGQTDVKTTDDRISPRLGPLEEISEQDQIPDGGYGWVVVLCVFVINTATWGKMMSATYQQPGRRRDKSSRSRYSPGMNSAYGVFLSYYIENEYFEGASQLRFAFVGGLSHKFQPKEKMHQNFLWNTSALNDLPSNENGAKLSTDERRKRFANDAAQVAKWEFDRITPCPCDTIETGGKQAWLDAYSRVSFIKRK